MTSYFPDPGTDRSEGSTATPLSASLSPPVTNSQRSNALSNRVASVLSASYADSDIRDALETLSLRGIRNTAETRRQLRLDVQKEVLDCNAEIVRDFGRVAEQLERIGEIISALNQTCDELRIHISLARGDTRPVLEEATALLKQKTETETKIQLFDAFTKHFMISDEDLLVLSSSEIPIDGHFFELLTRLKQIHHDCEILLGGESQKLGLEIMEQSSRSLNSAYQKLYRWVQKEFKSLNLEDPRIGSSIRQSLRVLAERPSLFHSCLDSFAEARDYVLSDAFHYALTSEAPGAGTDAPVKPIEFSAHDPLRYIGDMLAWVHSAAVSEREALEALFVADGDELARGVQAGLSSEPWSRIEEQGDVVFDGQKALRDLVNRDLAGVGRSLRQRIELVIQGQDEPVSCYKATNLVSFYGDTFAKLVGRDSQIVDLLQALEKFIFSHFETLMREQVHAVFSDPAALAPPDDLSAPDFLLDALEVLTSLMKAYEASFRTTKPGSSDLEDTGFITVLHAALDPFLDLAKSSAQELSNATTRTIYETNLVLATRATVSRFPSACFTHLNTLSATLSSLRMTLVDIQHQYLLENSGLRTLLTALEPFSHFSKPSKQPATRSAGVTETAPRDEQTTHQQQQHPSSLPNLAEIASLPAFQPGALVATGQQLDDFLPSALMDATEHLKQVQSAAFVKSVTDEAVEAFCLDFEFVEGMIIGADEARGKLFDVGGSDDVSTTRSAEEEKEASDGAGDWSLRALFPRTTGEIRVLLS